MRYKAFIVTLLISQGLAVDTEKDLQTQFILAEPGDTITIPNGTHNIKGALSIEGKENLVIRGSGMNRSILSFAGQAEGAQGISITNSKNIILEDFSVHDTKGDAIKVQYTDGIIFRRVSAEWTGGPKESNGAYGLYPVLCQNVLIEHSVAIAASDAGIYVGQSRDIVVRYSIAVNNVAGIEIENSIDAEVYENHTYDNTGGILIFDLPDLVQKKGGHIRVYNNLIEHNNLFNFAPKGSIVGKVIPGTGVMVLATSDVHVYDNTIRNNKSVGTAIVSYFITEEAINDSLYNPYTSSIHIYNNTYERTPGLPALDYEIGQLLAIKYGRNTPDIIYDGMPDPAYINAEGIILPESNLCIQNNSEARFTNMDIENNFEKWYSPFLSDFSEDLTPFHCGITHHPVATSK